MEVFPGENFLAKRRLQEAKKLIFLEKFSPPSQLHSTNEKPEITNRIHNWKMFSAKFALKRELNLRRNLSRCHTIEKQEESEKALQRNNISYFSWSRLGRELNFFCYPWAVRCCKLRNYLHFIANIESFALHQCLTNCLASWAFRSQTSFLSRPKIKFITLRSFAIILLRVIITKARGALNLVKISFMQNVIWKIWRIMITMARITL